MAVTLVAMPAERYDAWFLHAAKEYAADLERLGRDAAEAKIEAQRDIETYFPGGRPLPGHHLMEIHDEEDQRVGYLWIGPSTTGAAEQWWLWDVFVDEAHRGQGYARAALLLGEKLAAQHGATSVGLSVFGFNTGAKALYESLGYSTTAIKMLKQLNPADGHA